MLLKQRKECSWATKLWSYCVLAASKIITVLNDTVAFVKAYFRIMWTTVKQIIDHMQWGTIWKGLKLVAMSLLMSWKLASNEVKAIQETRDKTIAANLKIGAPEGYYQQAKFYLM